MGASFWQHWVPYEPDLDAALERIRDRVFAKGDYYRGHGEHRVVSPTSIEDVFHQLDDMGSAEGTHSILDVGSIGPEPAFGVVAPLSEHELEELFETAKPTRAQIDAKVTALRELRGCWEGTYVIAFERGKPREILFLGFSGD